MQPAALQRGGRLQVPPPGAYEVADLWRKNRDPRRRTEAFISKVGLYECLHTWLHICMHKVTAQVTAQVSA
jgi:hypothetical protein